MNTTFEQSRKKAETLAKSPRKTTRLVEAAFRLLMQQGKGSSMLGDAAGKIRALGRMLRCYATREYTDIPWQTIVLIAAALIYFVAPFDLIPDFIPLVGFADDVAIISSLFSSIITDVERFTAWEARKVSGAATADYTVLEAGE
ncbi:MAG: YkvA family protein [Chlorobiaceae bacterium]